MHQTLHRLAETFGIVTPTARQSTLPPALRQLHQLILLHFAEHATAPEPGQLREWTHQLDIELDAALAQLVSVDLVETDPATAQLLGAYPFSTIPRGHKVQLDGGPTVEAYCAIDALGIPAMLDRDVVISSQDPHTGEPIGITVTNGQASWRPDNTVVLLGSGPAAAQPRARAARTSPSTAHRLPLRHTCRPPTSPERSSPNYKRWPPARFCSASSCDLSSPSRPPAPQNPVARLPIMARLQAKRERLQGFDHALARPRTPLDSEEEQRPRARFAPVPGGSCSRSPSGPLTWTVRVRRYQHLATCNRDRACDGLRRQQHRRPTLRLTTGPEHHDQWHWLQPYRRYAELLAQLPWLAAVADAHRELWTRLVAAVPSAADDQRPGARRE